MTPEETKIIEKFRSLSDTDRDMLLRVIRSLPGIRGREAEPVALPSNVVKFPLRQTMRDHPHLNGYGQTERLQELDRLYRRIDNTVAALKRRKRAIPRAWRIEVVRYRRSLEEGEA